MQLVYRYAPETACGYYNKKGMLLGELEHAKIWDMEDLGGAVQVQFSWP
jgi:hypothetical protein